jgi:hypothetical protein
MNRKSLAPTIALGLMLGTLPAAADQRDLVLERVSRCYALGDTRQYLECLYGAVQPLRNELGLPQAPQAATFASLFAQPAPAQAPRTAAAPAAQSAQQAQKPGFLTSMFTEAVGIRTVMVPPEQFGLRNARPGPGRNVDHITARMTEYSLDRRTGAFVVTLENGQVWRRGRTEERLPSWTRPAASYVATVSYGAGNSYNLTVEGERRPYKVDRIR